jgi:hypothetical protein
VRAGSPVGAKYDTAVDRASAAEMLQARHADAAVAAGHGDAPPRASQGNPPAPARRPAEDRGLGQSMRDAVFGTSRRQGMVESMAKQAARTVGSQVGRQILRGVLGGIFGGRR